MQRILWTLTILLLTAANCAAGQHALRVTRVADDLYAAWAWDVLIRTKFCFEQAAGARAVLTSDRNGLLFPDSGRRCAVEDVYVRKLLRRGRHELVVTREEEGLYRIGDTKVVIFTAAHWPYRTRRCWNCLTGSPARCACTMTHAGSKASSRRSRTEA